MKTDKAGLTADYADGADKQTAGLGLLNFYPRHPRNPRSTGLGKLK